MNGVAVLSWLNRASVDRHRHGNYKQALGFMQQMTDYVEA